MLRRWTALLLLFCSLTMLSCSAVDVTSSSASSAPAASYTETDVSVSEDPAGSVNPDDGSSIFLAGEAVSFPDVQPGQWFYNVVMGMTQAGWLTGRTDGKFYPDDTISCAEFVTVVTRAAGLTPSAQTQTGHWAAGRLQVALDRGLYDWDEIPPTGEQFDVPIPRQLAAKIVMKAFFPDRRGDYNTQSAKIRDFSTLNGRYYEPVLAAYEAGVVNGDSQGNFNPTAGMTRAEACAIVQRSVNLGEAPQVPAGSDTQTPTPQQPAVPETPPTPQVPARTGGVSQNGRLQVIGTQLCNAAGEPIVLRGMSSHGMQWYGQYASEGAIRTTAEYGANVFRIAMYTGENGYLSQPAQLKAAVIDAADAAIRQDLYVIIDWHILSDGNPRSHQTEAIAFFTEMAQRYKDTPNVLYEICNEPNGGVSWAGDVKPYAQAVTDAIRAVDPLGVILIGSPTWSQDINQAADDPVIGTNLMYTLHFYAGTHGASLRERIDYARSKGAAIFISEWGTSRADGGGGVFLNEAGEWLDFLNARQISWCNWSLCDKNETSAALAPGASANGGWTEAQLSESGRFVFSRFSG